MKNLKELSWRYKSNIVVIFDEPFLQWLCLEMHNIYEWNKKDSNFKGVFNKPDIEALLRFKEDWELSIRYGRIYFFSAKPFFTLRKGIKFNTKKGQIIIS